MRQRNTGSYPLDVMTDPPFKVQPGEIVDFPTLIAGLTPVVRAGTNQQAVIVTDQGASTDSPPAGDASNGVQQ